LGTLERDIPYPGEDAEGPRGRLGSVKSCALPESWLDSRELSSTHKLQLQQAELSVSGG
jgi:nitrate/nitrite-specific signal transduction histidine kinase